MRVEQRVAGDEGRAQSGTALSRDHGRMVFDLNAESAQRRAILHRLALDGYDAVQRPPPPHDAAAQPVTLVAYHLDVLFAAECNRNGNAPAVRHIQAYRHLPLDAFIER